MSSPLHDRLDKALGELTERRAQLARVTGELAEATASATSKDRSLTVVLHSSGEIKELTFHGTKYRRLPAAELSRLIVSTIRAARAESMELTARAFEPLFGNGLPVRDMLAGRLDLDAVASGAQRSADELFAALNRPAAPTQE